ncbi:MAG TPA: Sapep family Mn(2+)-dependent dipeptidase [Clostridia bacterium]|nr:Sapep family Mn(2+)-dependent dipeptidase [Clostridia bacterium]
MISNSLLKFAAGEDWHVYNDDEAVFGEVNGFTVTAKTNDTLTSFFLSIAGIAPEDLIEFTAWLESSRFPLKLVDYEMTDNFIAVRAKDTAFSGTAKQIKQFLTQLTDKLEALHVAHDHCAICGLKASQKALYVGLYAYIHPDCIDKEGVDYTAPALEATEEQELVILTNEGECADEAEIVDHAKIETLAQEFASERANFLRDLSLLCSIPSVDGKPEEGAPFGREPQRALIAFLDMADRMGFHTVNVDHHAGYAQMGDGDAMVAAVCHLDVVPAGSGWDEDPFTLRIEGDRITARGVMDDKGPCLAVLYAMKSLLGDETFTPAKRIRLIVGVNEEKGSACMAHYRETEEIPDAGFTADAQFPAIYAEKGNAVIELVQKRAQDDLIEHASAGEAVNMVPGRCVTQLKGVGAKTYEGTIAHASTPEAGVNAISVAMDKVAVQIKEMGAQDRFVEFYNHLLGWELDGSGLGLAFEDETGKTTVNAAMLTIDGDQATLTLNIRYPVHFDLVEGMKSLDDKLKPHDVEATLLDDMPPLCIPKDSFLIQTLMSVYNEATGTCGQALAIGGGTYARSLPNICGFGPVFPGDPEVAHQANEWASVDKLLAGAAMYREVLKRLAGQA